MAPDTTSQCALRVFLDVAFTQADGHMLQAGAMLGCTNTELHARQRSYDATVRARREALAAAHTGGGLLRAAAAANLLASAGGAWIVAAARSDVEDVLPRFLSSPEGQLGDALLRKVFAALGDRCERLTLMKYLQRGCNISRDCIYDVCNAADDCLLNTMLAIQRLSFVDDDHDWYVERFGMNPWIVKCLIRVPFPRGSRVTWNAHNLTFEEMASAYSTRIAVRWPELMPQFVEEKIFAEQLICSR